MVDMWVTGPDALEVFADYAVNDFEAGEAKQLVVGNPDGHFIGDEICFASRRTNHPRRSTASAQLVMTVPPGLSSRL
ncbi:hypothetical protein JCM18750_38530 [Halostagnicola bangensis]